MPKTSPKKQRGIPLSKGINSSEKHPFLQAEGRDQVQLQGDDSFL